MSCEIFKSGSDSRSSGGGRRFYGNNRFHRNDVGEAMSLSELNSFVRKAVNNALPGTYWVCAETSDVRVNVASGHCYLEFIDKDERSGQIVAKARGVVWARTFHTLRPYFERETGQVFKSGLKILANVSVEFHELYGYSLNVYDIDPSYTVGDLVKKRKEIILRLQQEGIFGLNKELPFPSLPQRIAVITSPTAAGYEDFVDQLIHNKKGFPFYVKLFPAVMQGEKTEESIIEALERIFPHIGLFDVVAIIRGGGATSELSSFDSYLLAANCAQFPLPIITGIGHERDDTVVDRVAHSRMKTPTAVASFLIECTDREAERVQELENRIHVGAVARITQEKAVLHLLVTKFPVMVTGRMEGHRNRLHAMTVRLSAAPQGLRYRSERIGELSPRIQRAVDAALSRRATCIESMSLCLRNAVDAILSGRRRTLELDEQYIKMVSPEYILKRGYTLTMKEGKIVKYSAELFKGDEITVKFSDGERKGTIL
jgi:exodeoxyribonuclease VII large subunit